MLTQAEADTLIALQKLFVTAATITFPPGADETYELISADRNESFQLDIWRGTIRLSKLKFQNRSRKITVLVRLDIDGSPHTNPDGVRIDGSHIHIYREGYEDRWAFPVDTIKFPNTHDPHQAFQDFCSFCNIVHTPPIQGELM